MKLRRQFKLGARSFTLVDSDSLACAFSNGSVSLFSMKEEANVWNNSDVIGSIDDWFIHSLDASPDEQLIAVGRETYLQVIHSKTGKTAALINHDRIAFCVRFLSNENIACGLDSGNVAIVSWKTKSIEKNITVGTENVYSLATALRKNNILFTGDADGVIKQISVSLGTVLMTYEGHKDAIHYLHLSNERDLFVSGSEDHTARLYLFDQKQAMRVFHGHSYFISFVSLLQNDELLLTCAFDRSFSFKLWSTDSGTCLSTVNLNCNNLNACVSKDEKSLMILSTMETVSIYEIPPPLPISLDRTLKLTFGESVSMHTGSKRPK